MGCKTKYFLQVVFTLFFCFQAPAQSNPKFSPQQIANAPCVDEGFEGLSNGPLSAVSWTSSITNTAAPFWYHPLCVNNNYVVNNTRAEVVSTPTTDALLGAIPNSPYTGSKVLRLNRFTPYPAAKISQIFNVTPGNFVYRYAYLGHLNVGTIHNICDQPGLAFRFYDCSNTLIGAFSKTITLNANPDAALWNMAQSPFVISYTASTPAWASFNINLAAYIGSCVRVDVIATGCSFSDGDYGFCYYDADCSDKFLNLNGNLVTGVSFSSCAQTATLAGLSGFQAYSWQGPTASGITGSTLSMVTSSVAGIYTLTATSGTNTFVQTVNVVFGGFNSVTISGNSITCAGQPVVLQALAGTPGTFTWSNGSTATSITVSPTVTSTYSVVASSTNNCVAYATQQVLVNANPVFTIAPVNSSVCPGQSIILSATVSGSNTYSWSTGANQSSLQVNPTVSSVYIATVTSQAGCKAIASASVAVQTPVLSTLLPVSPVCAGKTTTLQLNTNDLVSCNWNHGATGTLVTVSPTITTVYTATATNVAGCSAVNSTTVLVNALPVLQPAASATQVCAGSSVMLWADTNGQQQYSWSNGATSNSIMLSPSITSVYSSTVTNANGCKASVTLTVNVNPLPQLIALVSPINICAGSTATLQATGAANYTWYPLQISLPLTTVTPLASQVYTLSGSSVAGCTNSALVPLTIRDSPVITTGTNINFCTNQATLTAGGTVSYSWMPGMLTGSQVVVNPTTTTQYTLTGSDGTCQSQAICTVSVGTLSSFLISSATHSACSGSCVNFSIKGTGYNLIKFSWGDSTETLPDMYQHCYRQAGIYSIQATATHSSGCIAASINTYTIEVIASPVSYFEAEGGYIQPKDAAISINNFSSGGDLFIWNFGDSTTLLSDIRAELLKHTYSEIGNYCIKLIAKNTKTGCEGQSTKCVDIYCRETINLPNVFTPNGDNVNDVFRFDIRCGTFVDCTIFDRWGSKTYEWSNDDGGWDGKTLSGEASSDGTFYYALRYLDAHKTIVKKYGYVVLLR